MSIELVTASIDEAVVFVRTAQPGDALTYYTGCLAEDKRKSRRLDKVAKFLAHHADVLDPAKPPLVHLMQERIGPGVYRYIAVKRGAR